MANCGAYNPYNGFDHREPPPEPPNVYNPYDHRDGQPPPAEVIRTPPPEAVRPPPEQAIAPIVNHTNYNHDNNNNNNNGNGNGNGNDIIFLRPNRVRNHNHPAHARARRLPPPPPGRHRRNNHPHHLQLRRSGWASDSDAYDDASDDDFDYPYYTSDDDEDPYYYAHPHYHPHVGPRPRDRHRHIHLPAGLPLPMLPFANNQVVVRRPAAAAAPRNYGYRRFHYQGGQERGRGRRRTGTHHHCGPAHGRGNCSGGGGAAAPEPQRNILKRCGRWLFGDSGRCLCGQGCGGAMGGGSRGGGCCEERSRSRSPTRHREEEYWGPGAQDWAYGPPGNRSASWRDTPWSGGGGNGMPATHNLAPGAVVEEVEEGGTLPTTTTTLAAGGDRTHNHYHLGTDGGGRRRRGGGGGGRSSGIDNGLMTMVDKERDREMQKNILAGEREWSEREAAWNRDMEMLRLLDRERRRGHQGANGHAVGVTHLLEGELGRSRLVNPPLDPPEPIILDAPPARRQKVKILKAGKKARNNKDGDGGLKSEMEALRNDLKKLLKNSSKASSVAGEDKVERSVSTGGSTASRRNGTQSPPTADIHFERGRPRVIEVEDDEDDDEGDESA